MLKEHEHQQHHNRAEGGHIGRMARNNQLIQQVENGNQVIKPIGQNRKKHRQLGLGQAFHPELGCFDMGDEKKCHIRGKSRYGCRFAHFEIGQIDIFGNNKSGRAHNRWHQLAVGRNRDFNGRGFFGRIANFFHQGNGEGPSGDHVGNGGAGNEPRQSRGQDGGFGRSALVTAKEAHGQINKKASRPGFFKQGAEEHVKKDDFGRHVNRHTENPFCRQGNLADETVDAHPFKCQKIRHIGAKKRVKSEKQPDNRQRRTHHPPGPFPQKQNQQGADDHVAGIQPPDTCGYALEIDDDIQGQEGSKTGQQQIHQGNAIGGRKPTQAGNIDLTFQGGEGDKDQKQGKRQVNGANIS